MARLCCSPKAHVVAEDEHVGEVPIDGGGGDGGDPWHGVDDGVIVGTGVVVEHTTETPWVAAWRESSTTVSWKRDLASSMRGTSWPKETEMTSAPSWMVDSKPARTAATAHSTDQ